MADAIAARGVVVRGFTVGEDIAELAFETKGPGLGQLADELYIIGEEYLEAVGAGMRLGRLNGEIVDSSGARLATFQIRALWANRHMEGEISREEYFNRVADSVRNRAPDFPTVTPTATPTPTPTPVPGTYNADRVRSEARSIEYDTLFRNIERYKKEAVYFKYGNVYQAIYEDDYTYLQLNVADDEQAWDGDVAATYWGADRILENDLIELWAMVEGLYEYTTVQGNVRTIPLLTVVDYELYE